MRNGAEYHKGISLHKIPVEGAVGLLFVFATLYIFGIGIPAVRQMLLITVPLGIFGAGALYFWRTHHRKKIQSLHLHGSEQVIKPQHIDSSKDLS
jgi:hypothetical protein